VAWQLAIHVTVLAILVVPGLLPVTDAEVTAFERDYRLSSSEAERRFVRDYLTIGNRLRRLAFVVALALPLLTGAVLTDEVVLPEIFSTRVLIALIAGTLLAEVTITRPTGQSRRRLASLRPRELRTYLSRTLRYGPAISSAASSAAWLGTLSFGSGRRSVAWPNPTSRDVAAGVVVAALVPLLVTLACRWIVQRPQPYIDATLVAADDAARTASVRRVAAMGCLVALFNLAGALERYTHTPAGYSDALPAAGIAAALLLAWVAWLARTWDPIRPVGSQATSPATAEPT
jgi:hypothetical protein